MSCTLNKVLLQYYIEGKVWKKITLFNIRREYTITENKGGFLLSERINETPGKLRNFATLHGLWTWVHNSPDEYPIAFSEQIVDLILARVGGE